MSEQRAGNQQIHQRNSWNSLWVPTHSSQKPSILVINRLNQESDSNWSRRKEAKRVSFPKRTTRSSRNSRNTRVEARPSSLLSSGWCNKVIGPFKICAFFTRKKHCSSTVHGKNAPHDPQQRENLEHIWWKKRVSHARPSISIRKCGDNVNNCHYLMQENPARCPIAETIILMDFYGSQIQFATSPQVPITFEFDVAPCFFQCHCLIFSDNQIQTHDPMKAPLVNSHLSWQSFNYDIPKSVPLKPIIAS